MSDHPDQFPDNDDFDRFGAAAPAPDVERLLADYQLASRIADAETESLTIYPLDSMLSNAPDTRPRAGLIYDARSNQTKFFPDLAFRTCPLLIQADGWLIKQQQEACLQHSPHPVMISSNPLITQTTQLPLQELS